MSLAVKKTPYLSRVKPPLGVGLNFANPLAKKLTYAWMLNEKASTPRELLSGKVSTISGTVTWIDGISGPGMNDLNAGYINTGIVPTLVNTVTLECFVLNANPNSNNLMIGCSDFSSTGQGYRLYANGLGTGLQKFKFGVGDGVTYTDITGTITFAPNTWHHIVGVRDGTSMKLYLDGVLDNFGSCSTGAPAAATNILLGAQTVAGGADFHGTLEVCRIYNAALSEEEVKRLYNAPFEMFSPKQSYIPTATSSSLSYNLLKKTLRPRVFSPGIVR